MTSKEELKMKKYIRTNNQIIETTKLEELTSEKYVNDAIQSGFKTSDNLVDLCDEFIVWQKDYEYETPITIPLKEKDRYNGMKTIIQLGLLEGVACWLKLAIWTDKGLIYVAKMNEEGEFELI